MFQGRVGVFGFLIASSFGLLGLRLGGFGLFSGFLPCLGLFETLTCGFELLFSAGEFLGPGLIGVKVLTGGLVVLIEIVDSLRQALTVLFPLVQLLPAGGDGGLGFLILGGLF